MPTRAESSRFAGVLMALAAVQLLFALAARRETRMLGVAPCDHTAITSPAGLNPNAVLATAGGVVSLPHTGATAAPSRKRVPAPDHPVNTARASPFGATWTSAL